MTLIPRLPRREGLVPHPRSCLSYDRSVTASPTVQLSPRMLKANVSPSPGLRVTCLYGGVHIQLLQAAKVTALRKDFYGKAVCPENTSRGTISNLHAIIRLFPRSPWVTCLSPGGELRQPVYSSRLPLTQWVTGGDTAEARTSAMMSPFSAWTWAPLQYPGSRQDFIDLREGGCGIRDRELSVPGHKYHHLPDSHQD